MRKMIIGLDLGTTALKIALFDQQGSLLGVSTREYPLITARADYVEADVQVYWESFKAGLSDLQGSVGFEPDEIQAIGLSAQGETLFLLDRDGRPLRNAIVWMDNRARLRRPCWPNISATKPAIRSPARSVLSPAGQLPRFYGSAAMNRSYFGRRPNSC